MCIGNADASRIYVVEIDFATATMGVYDEIQRCEMPAKREKHNCVFVKVLKIIEKKEISIPNAVH